MRLIKGTELTRRLGISPRTLFEWSKQDPKLSVIRKNACWFRADRLAAKTGMDIVDILMIPHRRLVRASKFAKHFKVSRKTVANWCKDQAKFAFRFGRNYYIDLDGLGLTEEQVVGILSQLGYYDL